MADQLRNHKRLRALNGNEPYQGTQLLVGFIPSSSAQFVKRGYAQQLSGTPQRSDGSHMEVHQPLLVIESTFIGWLFQSVANPVEEVLGLAQPLPNLGPVVGRLSSAVPFLESPGDNSVAGSSEPKRRWRVLQVAHCRLKLVAQTE